MIVRPVRSSDLPALIDLARSTGTGPVSYTHLTLPTKLAV